MGHPVARQENPQSPSIRRIARADHPGPGAEPDEYRPPGQEGAQDHVSHAGLAPDDLAQALPRDLQDLAGSDDACGQVDGLAGEQVELPDEAPLAVDADRAFAGTIRILEDRHLARQHDEEVVGDVAVTELQVTRRGVASGAVLLERRDGVIAQARKRALAVTGLLAAVGRGSGSHLLIAR